MTVCISTPHSMRRSLVLLSLAVSSVAFCGCATITRGTHEALVIESEPSGAQVRLSTGFTGTTPTSCKISRKGEVFVTISKEGYETVNVNVTTQVAGAGAAGMAGNVLVGGLIGAGVDAFSGGMLEHKPNPVRVTLVPLKPVAAGAMAGMLSPAPTAVALQPIPPVVTPPPAPSPAAQVVEPPLAPVAVTPAPTPVVAPPAPMAAPAQPDVAAAPKPAVAGEAPEAPKQPVDAAASTEAKPSV